ncbi:indolepyruvate ferredoxin oxidoreductase subunit alpha [Streptomyces spinosisporus]|uniref:Ferredoxin n=1 Tax=Streptomyces spinosisporus TaxID=2927582 RepID=A0ABS9XUE4_9ACTN|nr:ferredoxin family protein [Streptomyces spinosisporus]MCI3245708.1 ferredoxin family protein [Streptomyces spinosisporus]
MPFYIGEACVDEMDKSCTEECPVDCIYEGDRKLYINPSECIDCGACETVCPVEAISSTLRGTPDTEWVADNAAFFTETLPGRAAALGNPGGSRRTGALGVDTAKVTSLESRV